MRLACESCAAVYLIDDGAMTPRGVRAQCPRCKNIQYVPPPADPQANPATRAREMANPISVSRPPVPGRELEPEAPARSQVARVTLTQRMVARPPAPPPEALLAEGPEARAELFGELAWSDTEPPVAAEADAGSPSPPTSRPGLRPSVGAPSRVTLPPPAPEAARPPASAFAAADFFAPEESPPASPAGEPAAEVSCASCGGALPELEDLASGVCTSCRITAAARLAPRPMAAPPALVDAAPLERRNTSPPRRTPAVPRPAAALRPRRWTALAALGGVVVLGLAAMLWLYVRGSASLRVRLPVRPVSRVDPLSPLPTGLAERLASWSAKSAGPAPGAKQTLVEAERELALDQPAAYAAAEARLQKALVGAPRDPELLGAWLTAVALGRGSALDAAELGQLVQLGESAAGTSRRAPAVLVGLAELLLVSPDAAAELRARALAQEALGADGTGPVGAHLVVARTYVRTSADLALGELQKAEQADPSQRRIPLLRAEAFAANGQPREALGALQARLALEPDHAASLFGTGRLLVEVGEPEQARRLFERLQVDPRTEDGPALLALAALDSLQGRPREAVQLLRGALKRDHLTPAARVRTNALLAAAARAAGDAETAASAARTALALEGGDAGAHLQLLLLALDRGDGAAAAEHQRAVEGKLGDAGLEALLEGRVRMAQGQPAAAAEAFARAAQTDARRTDALLWGAAAQAAVPSRGPALALLTAAEQADPTRAGPFSPLSELSLRPEESLRAAEAPLEQLAQGASDANPLVGLAVLRFHRRDWAGAEAALARALKVDAAFPQALAWRALVLLERGDGKGAGVAASLAQQRGRALPMVQYAAGAAALAVGDLDGARRWLREVTQSAPGLLAAQVKLAEAETRAGAPSVARERLRKVVHLDPSYASAKRALYLLPKEN
ncbi:MAG: zinc-ribbon domain-containing protein [Myxococcaceae bacterium]